MMRGSLVSLLLLSLCSRGWSNSFPGVVTSEHFQQQAVLDHDGNYILFWNFNDTTVTFEVHVRTRGWVGFGLSPNGNMYPGDVVVGWVSSDGTAHFADRHTTGHRPPLRDASQDWTLLFSEENEFGTVLKFVRKISTCDTNEDIEIPQGTVRVIYAYSAVDPVSEDGITYHGTTRGTKSLFLLSKNHAPVQTTRDAIHYDFLNGNYLLPNDTTTYYCKGFLMPDIGKHHMIKYEPVITPGNELNVHHILLYKCPGVYPPSKNGVSGLCDQVRHSHTLPACSSVWIAWAIGGEAFYFPDNIGLPVSDAGHPTYYVMETHYDNPTQRTGVIDDSGLRLTITKNLRQYDAGLLELGQKVDLKQMIPPFQKEFVSKAYCSDTCISAGMSASHRSEIKMFGAVQHSHLLGVSIKTRHFRNGTEIRPVIEDPDYDFNFQQTRILPNEVPVYPGDSFSVECTYDSTSRTGPTFGGLSTQEEMCLTFVYYYPKMDVSTCISIPLFDSYHMPIPELYKHVLTADWSDQSVVDDYKHRLATSKVEERCAGEHGQIGTHRKYVPTEPAHPYVEPAPVCT